MAIVVVSENSVTTGQVAAMPKWIGVTEAFTSVTEGIAGIMPDVISASENVSVGSVGNQYASSAFACAGPTDLTASVATAWSMPNRIAARRTARANGIDTVGNASVGIDRDHVGRSGCTSTHCQDPVSRSSPS